MANLIKAFTLIELLVVVLIIGMLTAVAVPQYQKTVEKAKATQAWTVLKTLAQAQQAYFLANGEYAQSFAELGIDMSAFPGNTEFNDYHNCTTDTRSNAEWSFQIQTKPGCIYKEGYPVLRVLAGRITGPYQGAGWAIELDHNNRLLCIEQTGQGFSYNWNNAGNMSYCVHIFGVKQVVLNGIWNGYVYP